MDVLYRLEQGTVHDVLAEMDDPPSYNSVRVIMGILEDKGYVVHEREGKRYVYRPRKPHGKAGRDAAEHLLKTFFGDSTPKAVATLLDVNRSEISDEELDELDQLIKSARRQRRRE